MRARSLVAAGAAIAWSLAAGCAVAQDAASTLDLRDLSLGELLQVRVTSASRKEEPLSSVAAAAHVITAEDIRRSGAVSIPDLLRSVPGLHVAQLNASTWAVGSRGFADTYSDKLLVLVDGRSLYTPLFSGVSWDAIDIALSDIERIEVIRGPGASLWGANAVNGVINIIQKSATDSQGTSLRMRTGSDEHGALLVQHGFRAGERTAVSLSVREFRRDGYRTAEGDDAHDAWRSRIASLRLETDLPGPSKLTIAAGASAAVADMLNQSFPVGGPSAWIAGRRDVSGEHVQATWTRESAPGRRLTLNASASHAVRDEPDFEDRLTTFDFDLAQRLPAGRRHDLTWGIALRQARDEVVGTYSKGFADPVHVFRMASAFAQDDVRLSETTRLTLGMRLQRDELGDVAVQPTIRVAWHATPRLLAWGAASRALRTSSRVDLDARLTASSGWSDAAGMPRVVRVEGREQNAPETLASLEAGLRWSPGEHLALDVSLFHSEYEGLRTFEAEAPRVDEIDGTPVLVVPARVDNLLQATSRGLELGLSWSPVKRLRLRLAATALDVSFRHAPGSSDIYMDTEGDRGNTPKRRGFLAAQIDLPKRCELDATVEHASGWAAPGMDAMTRFGLRFGWRASEHFELAVSVRDLFDAETREHSGATPFTHVEPIPRAGRLSLTWKF